MHQLIRRIKEVGAQYPTLQNELQDLYELAISEIQCGESEENEINLCYNSIEELIEEHINETN